MTADAVLAAIAPNFQIAGNFVSAEPFGNGHINESYLARYRCSSGERRFIFQRINERVFSNVPALMENIGRVTRHAREKLEASGTVDIDRRTITLVSTGDGGEVFRAADGSWWRAYAFVDAARTYEVAASTEIAYNAARAFGAFLEMLSDIDGEALHETIPSFHATPKYWDSLLEAIENDACARRADACAEIAFCRQNEPLIDALEALRREGVARECVTHNDTKLNNVLIDDRTGEGICVIDLDTVMPGIALYDFGDLVRSATMTAAEDERDLRLVDVDVAMFEAVTRGFVEGARGSIESCEARHLVTAAKVIAFECGMRFLADHLTGDRYFRIRYPGHNLDRSRTQFALVRALAFRESSLRDIAARILQDRSPHGYPR